MNNTVSFMSANYVARQLGYKMTGGWGQGDKASNEHFRPIETFAERFEEVLKDVRALGFTAIDLWTGHLNPQWATDEHIAIARDLLKKHELSVPSLAGGFGATPEAFETSCKLAATLGAPVLGGFTPLLERDRKALVRMLENYGLKLGLENHPEKTPEELLQKVGDGGNGIIGVAIDTGWFGTQGYNAAKAIEELAGHLFHVHLKDVLEVGAHNTCRFGEGIVNIRDCVDTLKRIGYEGAISIEHEPEHYDPSEDCRESLKLLQEWMGENA